MENKLLLEEIKRFRLMSGYDSGKTSTENNRYINEQESAVRDVVKALKDAKAATELRSVESAIMRDIAGEIKVGGKELTTTKEILDALSAGKLAEREAGSFFFSTLRNSKEGGSLNKATIDYLASQKTTLEYASRFKNAEELKASILKNPKNAKMSEKTAEDLANKIFEFRDAKEVESAKTAKELEQSKELKKSEEIKKQRERETERYETDKQKIELENERILRQSDAEAREAMAQAERSNAKIREIKTTQEAVEAETMLMKSKESLAEARKAKPNVVLHWLKTNRIVNFVKKVIFNKYVLLLAGGSLAAYWAWNKFFKDNGITVKCDEGKVVDPKTGDCVDKSKLDGNNPEDDSNPENTDTPGTSTANNSSSEDGPNDGITYRNCSGNYSIGCKDLTYTDTIKQLQKCLGVKQTGYFGKNTERELESATNEKTIDRNGIRLLCGNF
jgi:hypothetical protein